MAMKCLRVGGYFCTCLAPEPWVALVSLQLSGRAHVMHSEGPRLNPWPLPLKVGDNKYLSGIKRPTAIQNIQYKTRWNYYGSDTVSVASYMCLSFGSTDHMFGARNVGFKMLVTHPWMLASVSYNGWVGGWNWHPSFLTGKLHEGRRNLVAHIDDGHHRLWHHSVLKRLDVTSFVKVKIAF